MPLGAKIKTRMQEMGVSTSELARRTGYTKQHIHDLLAGRRRWNETTLSKACAALGLELVIRDATGTDG
jgi:transcriptional regulator with XRE-family HTH domain